MLIMIQAGTYDVLQEYRNGEFVPTGIEVKRTLTVCDRRFEDDDVTDGEVGESTTDTEIVYNPSPAAVVSVLRMEGLDFKSTGSDWASNPDGSRITDYATGERSEVSAHLDGFTPLQMKVIMDYANNNTKASLAL